MVALQSAPSWDMVIVLIVVIGVTYGFVMLRERVLAMLLSLYAGVIVANTLAEPIAKFFNGDVALLNKIWVQSSASLFTIKLIIFSLTILVVNAKSNLSGRGGRLGYFELTAYSFFSVCIGLSAFFSFMEPDKLKAFVDTSKMVKLVVDHQALWLVAPIIVLAVIGSSRRARSAYYDDY